MRFGSIIGLSDVKEKLILSSGRNHHAQIFHGPPGSANLSMALAYASFINCQNPLSGDSCGECSSCRKIDKLIHPDIHFIFPISSTQKWKGKDVISDNFLTEWREFISSHQYPTLNDWVEFYGAENKQVNISKEESRRIIQKLTLKSFEARYKVMIIWLPEWMHPSAANAILKILEEPPPDTIFIMASNDHQKLLTTITSRTQLVNIRTNSYEEVIEFLTTQLEVDQKKAETIAHLSEGNMSFAQRLANEVDLQDSLEFSKWMRSCWQNDYSSLVDFAERYHSMDKVRQKNLLNYGLFSLRAALLSGGGINELILCNSEERVFIEKFGQTVSLSTIEEISNQISEAYYHLERNASAKITHLDLSLKISQLLKTKA